MNLKESVSSQNRTIEGNARRAIHVSRGGFAPVERCAKQGTRSRVAWLFGVFIFLFAAASVFVRYADFNERLVFGFDQGRDAIIVGDALRDGVSHLPLLGPRVAPTGHEHGYHFRLGPAYYYFQYIAGKIFHTDEPWVFAVPDAFFSAASAVLLFLLLIRVYSWDVSLIAATLYATSFLVVQYARFAWNPNSVAFFVMVALYAMIRAAEQRGGWRYLWISIWALSASIASQLHLTGALTVLGASLFFYYFLTRRSGSVTERFRRASRYLPLVAILFLVPYIPVFLSEILTSGANTNAAFSFFRGQSNMDTPFLLFGRAFKETFENYGLIVTSFAYDHMDRSNLWHTIAGSLTALILIVFAWIGMRATDVRQRLLCMAVLSWAIAHFIASIPIALESETRYYTAVFPIPFVAIAIFLGWVKGRANVKIFVLVAAAISLPILMLNTHEHWSWMRTTDNTPSKRLILKRNEGVVLADLEAAVRFLCDRSSSRESVHLLSNRSNLYQIRYLMRSCAKPPVLARGFSNNMMAEWYVINASLSGTSSLEGVNIGQAKVEKAMNSGFLSVWRVYPNRPKVDRHEPSSFPDNTSLETPRSDRRYWGDIFERDFFRRVDTGLTIAE